MSFDRGNVIVSGASTPDPSVTLAARLHAVLPQTQCTRCGYPDCAAYAAAIATADAAINQCPPGGAAGISRLASVTGKAIVPLNPVNGTEGARSVAVIDEAWCIGCTLCLEVCPTDAIFGSNKSMHTVIEPYCTGCELCIPVCPVDCISLETVTGKRTGWSAWSQAEADTALSRYRTRRLRLQIGNALQPPEPDGSHSVAAADDQSGPNTAADTRKREVIDAALARARAQRPVVPGKSS